MGNFNFIFNDSFIFEKSIVRTEIFGFDDWLELFSLILMFAGLNLETGSVDSTFPIHLVSFSGDFTITIIFLYLFL